MTLPAPPDVRQLLSAAGLAPKKSWSQSFLRDQRALADIAAATEAGPERPVVELGAGLGALTYHLLARGGRVLAVERDRELVPLLRDALAWSGERLEIMEADAARLDWAALTRERGGALTVAGNLPYHLSSRILVSLAEPEASVERAVVLIQKEVAERLVAEPGGKTRGLLSVLVQRRFAAKIVRHVSPGAFLPPPKVTSSVVRLDALPERSSPELDRVLVITAKAAFAQRRKTLKNSLAAGLGASGPAVTAALVAAGIDPVARPETLEVAELARVGEALAAAGLLPP